MGAGGPVVRIRYLWEGSWLEQDVMFGETLIGKHVSHVRNLGGRDRKKIKSR